MRKTRILPAENNVFTDAGSDVFPLDSYPAGLKWAVVTTIFPPTRLVKTLLHLDGWCTVVVADRKGLNEMDYIEQLGSNSSASAWCFVYLSVERQLLLKYSIIGLIPFDSFGRKNIGYIFAIHHGAKIVYDTDDDNEISDIDVLQSWASLDWGGSGSYNFNHLRNWKQTGANPYPLFGASDIWPRGLPLDTITDVPSAGAPLGHLPHRQQICIVQSIADHEPDVDAIYRLTNRNYPLNFHTDNRYSACLAEMAPFNAQATIFTENAFSNLLLPITVHGRVSDIWRGYLASATLSCSLAYVAPWVTQVRNSHDYLADFDAELPLYQQASAFVEYLSNTSYGDAHAAWTDAYAHGLVEEADVRLSLAWHADLTKAKASAASSLVLQERGLAVGFRHLFIVMGRGVHIRKWMQIVMGSVELSHVDMVVGVFDEPVGALGCQSVMDRVECLSCAGTSWVAGRNLLAKRAFQREKRLSIRYTFWTFADGDIELLCQLAKGSAPISDQSVCFSLYDSTLRAMPMGAAVVALIGTGWWSLDVGMVMVGLKGFDAAWNSFRHEALPLLLPYRSDLDHNSWWSAQAIFWNRVMCFAPLYAVAPLSLLYINPEHNDYPKNTRDLVKERQVGDDLMGPLSCVIQHAPVDYPAGFSADKVKTLPLDDVQFDPVYKMCSLEYVGPFYAFILGD